MLVPPIIKCGCGGMMVPENKNPMQRSWWHCIECGGAIDVWAPERQGRLCGAYFDGVRCGQPLERDAPICKRCFDHLIDAVFADSKQRASLARRVNGYERRQAELREAEQRKREQHRHRAELRAKRLDDSGNVVYYARLGRNHIKIGTTSDLRGRMTALRVVNEANLLAAEPGGYEVEHQRHEQFRKWRYHRRKEDFGEAPELLAHIEATRQIYGAPYELAARLACPNDLGDLESA